MVIRTWRERLARIISPRHDQREREEKERREGERDTRPAESCLPVMPIPPGVIYRRDSDTSRSGDRKGRG